MLSRGCPRRSSQNDLGHPRSRLRRHPLDHTTRRISVIPATAHPEEKLADAKRQLSLPRIVVICGSTRFMTEMTEADLRETKAGKIVVKPGCDMKSPHELWSDPAEAEALKGRLDDLHRAKIRLADEVLVVGDYIGDSTRAEIAYALSLGKHVRFTHPEVDPDA
ncbi:hypothetical protein [Streptomyces sp. NPDC048521]|uniref:hypothetical protein n=1 Tax=Streptomyces sp. NPDC048521 TaxID=3365566 RepID=UPI00371201B8